MTTKIVHVVLPCFYRNVHGRTLFGGLCNFRFNSEIVKSVKVQEKKML